MPTKLGLSGDSISIDGGNIIKVCETNQERFTRNVAKQMNFINKVISAIPILENGEFEGKRYIVMPYIKCDDCLSFIGKASIQDMNGVVDVFLAYFEDAIDNSQLNAFDYEPWHKKLEELKAKISDDELRSVIDWLVGIRFENEFYYGGDHGDFTLANLFIHKSGERIRVEAIDFLDTYISSPLNDIVKLRQDLFHCWCLTLTDDQSMVDRNRVLMALNFIDEKVKRFIEDDGVLSEYYVPLQLVNLLRILPYTRDAKLTAYLKEEVLSLHKEGKLHV